MKKLIASILTVLTIGASAQLTYVTTLDDDFYFEAPPHGRLENNNDINFIDNDKYLISLGPIEDNKTDVVSYCDILNSDFSLHKRITIDTTSWFISGYMLGGIFFSDHLYNSDDKIEIIYSLFKSKYDTTESGYDRDKPVKTVIIDEDGVVLQTIDNVFFSTQDIFQVGGKTYFSTSNGEEEEVYDIYEAAGTLPCKTCSSSESTPTQKAPEKVYDINVFPNPTSNQITLAINTDKTGMKVHIYSTDGKLVKSASVVNGNNLIDTADLVSGTYIYNVVTDDELIHASQFIKK